MFHGTVPSQCIDQITRVIDFGKWSKVFVGCSGTFRLERSIHSMWPEAKIISNDVSLYSTALARFAMGDPLPMKFIGDLEWVQQKLDAKDASPSQYLAALVMACQLAKFATGRPNAFKLAHVRHYKHSFDDITLRTEKSLTEGLKTLKLEGYRCLDWRLLVDEAIDAKAGLVAFPPFFKGDYEKQFEWVHNNVEWDEPTYDIYSPTELGGIITKIENADIPWFILSDQKFEGRKPQVEFVVGHKVPHYGYGSSKVSSYRKLRAKTATSEPFNYKPVDVSKLTRNSKITCVPATNMHINFFRNVHLQTGLNFSNGMFNYFIYADGCILGALCYRKPPRSIPGILTRITELTDGKFNADMNMGDVLRNIMAEKVMEMLSDPSVTTECKVSKFIAMLGKSRTLLEPFDKKQLRRTELVCTTARSDKFVSMKYRGPYKLLSRVENYENEGTGKRFRLSYGARVDERTPQEIYTEWWDKHGGKMVEKFRCKISDDGTEGA